MTYPYPYPNFFFLNWRLRHLKKRCIKGVRFEKEEEESDKQDDQDTVEEDADDLEWCY
jgi:hypothetical protein